MKGITAWPALLLAACLCLPSVQADDIVVYSARKEHLIKPLFDAYTRKTGDEITYITDKAAPLLARIEAEGANTRADMLMTVDVGNLWQAGQRGVLAQVDSDELKKNIPEHLRDPDDRWFGLSVRARTIVYSTERVRDGELVSYEDLADPAWKGRLCLRTSKKVYNQSLVAMMIARLGEEQTGQIVRGWVDNLATPPFANDTQAMKAILAGLCDVAIVNTYYFGRLQREQPDIPLALFWPNQDSSGVHINVSGAGITKHARNREAATRLLVWLSSTEAQELYASLNMEYPVNPQVAADPAVAAWGDFNADTTNLAQAGELQARAVMLMDRAGYK
jgi:iron(III) transport system substrate-binding protein